MGVYDLVIPETKSSEEIKRDSNILIVESGARNATKQDPPADFVPKGACSASIQIGLW